MSLSDEDSKGVGKRKSAEVEAFIERFNYFRKPYNARQEDGSGWREVKLRNGKSAYAGDKVVQDAIDGKGDIGMRMSYTMTFFGFDIDTPGKGKGNKEEQGNGSESESGRESGSWREEKIIENGHEGESALHGNKDKEKTDSVEIKGRREWGVEQGLEREVQRAIAGAKEQQEAAKNWSGWNEVVLHC